MAGDAHRPCALAPTGARRSEADDAGCPCLADPSVLLNEEPTRGKAVSTRARRPVLALHRPGSHGAAVAAPCAEAAQRPPAMRAWADGVPRPLGESEAASWASDDATPAAAVAQSELHPLASGMQQPCAQPQHLLPVGCVVIAHAARAVCHPVALSLLRFARQACMARRSLRRVQRGPRTSSRACAPAMAATCFDGQGLARTRPRGRIVSEPAEAR